MAQGDWLGITGLNEVALGVAARAYAAAGIPVFPLFGTVEVGGERRCECPAAENCDRPGKHPRVRWTHEATVDTQQVEEWWQRWPSANIGIPTGTPSGWCVLDLDVDEETSGESELDTWLETEVGLGWSGARLREVTLAQRTGGGGLQLVLRYPGEVRTVVGWLPLVDVKAEGGYIVAPPSKHVSGGTYRWVTENSPDEAPDRLAAALKVARGRGGAGGAGGGEGESLTGDEYRRALREGPSAGRRDVFFNQRAFELRKRGVSKPDATHELRGLWEKTPGGGVDDGSPPYAWPMVLEKIERIWRDVPPDEQQREPVTETMQAWARGSLRLVASNGERVDIDPQPPGEEPPGGGGGGGGGGARVVNESPQHAELATDLGTAIRYARIHSGRLRFVPGIGWIVWTGTHWQPDETGYAVAAMIPVIADIRRQAEESDYDEAQQWARWALACESAGRMFGIVRLAENLPQLVVSPDTLDRHMNLLCCPNGIVDLATGALLEHRQDYYITNCTGVDYDPEATSALLDEFHRTFLPNPEVAAYVYQTVGAALWGGNRGKRFVVITGDTGTGKSMWTSGVKAALGTYAASVNSSIYRGTLGDAPRPDLLHVVRKRLAIAEEGSKQWELHTDQVKRITGGDSIVARAMRSDRMIERVPDFTPLLVTNEMPHIKGADEAVRRRILALPFNRRVVNEDVTKKAEFIHDEATQRALLALLVKGCMRAPVDADISGAPREVVLTTMDAFDSLDDVTEFIASLREDGRLIEDPELSNSQCASTKEMHNEYVQWVTLHGSAEDRRNRLGIKQFSARLEQMGWKKVRSNGTRWAGKALGMTTSV